MSLSLSMKKKMLLGLALLMFCMALCPYPVFAHDVSVLQTLSPAASPFSDVAPDTLCASALQELKDAGIVCGYPDGTFHPEKPITGQEYLLLLDRTFGIGSPASRIALEMKGPLSPVTVSDAVQKLLLRMGVSRRIAAASIPQVPGVDPSSFSGRAGEGFLYAAYYFKILDSSFPAALDCQRNITRGEAARMLANARDVSDVSIPLPEQMYGIPVSFQGEKAVSYVNDIASALSCFPSSVLTAYAASSGAITVTDESSSRYYKTSGDVSGMFWPNSNKITLFSNGRASTLFHSLERTTRHEMGHFIYDSLVSPADRTALSRLVRSEEFTAFASACCHGFSDNTADEYFAELVAYMTLYGYAPACASFPESAAIAAHYLELEAPYMQIPTA